jgi:hypothetical protein
VSDKPKRRWYQFSIKGLLIVMLLSAFVAAVVSLQMRGKHYQERAVFHRSQIVPLTNMRRASFRSMRESTDPAVRAAGTQYEATMRFHEESAKVYEEAARHPWLTPSLPAAP